MLHGADPPRGAGVVGPELVQGLGVPAVALLELLQVPLVAGAIPGDGADAVQQRGVLGLQRHPVLGELPPQLQEAGRALLQVGLARGEAGPELVQLLEALLRGPRALVGAGREHGLKVVQALLQPGVVHVQVGLPALELAERLAVGLAGEEAAVMQLELGVCRGQIVGGLPAGATDGRLHEADLLRQPLLADLARSTLNYHDIAVKGVLPYV